MLRLDEVFCCYNVFMSQTILYIDGENIRHYIRQVLTDEHISEKDLNFENFDLNSLLNLVLKNILITEKRYYVAKLQFNEDNPTKSKELILKQRIQKSNLERNGIKYILGGNVRSQDILVGNKKKTVFREKGVDVKIAVDLVANACDKVIDTAVLCSSDSDLQPAVKEAISRGVKIIYLGFEINPNKGLSYTTDRTILIRNSEILDVYRKSILQAKKSGRQRIKSKSKPSKKEASH